MEKVLDVAKYIINRYEEVAGVTIDELKLHKLLYFVQREAIAITGNPMFKEDLKPKTLHTILKQAGIK